MDLLLICPLTRRMRLDVFLVDGGYVDSRTDAKGFITSGAVTVNDVIVKKPAFDVIGNEIILVDKSGKKYVSRGGLKLEGALDSFNIDVRGVLALDIGASSGGFTDCLLKRGASHVYAVDSGSGQIVDKLRCDERVTVIENYNARYMSSEDFSYIPDFAVMDVSFISATLIIPAVAAVIKDGGRFVCLIKPQFEVGRGGLNKNGIVKSDKLRRGAVDRVVESASLCGFTLLGLTESPIVGGDGNAEYLAYFSKG